ncbi:hypothetical protein Hanom_Chr01g00037161 [Helianthus anomalus]
MVVVEVVTGCEGGGGSGVRVFSLEREMGEGLKKMSSGPFSLYSFLFVLIVQG